MTPRDLIDGTQILAWILAVALFLRMRRSLAATESENTRLRQALAESEERERDANEAAMGLTDELDEYRKEEAKRERRREGMALN